MGQMIDAVSAWLTGDRLMSLLQGLLILVLGWPVARWAARSAANIAERHGSPQSAMIARRGVQYVMFFILFGAALNAWGFNLGVLLGAAGLLTVAVGFAAQTSTSNLISGLFLVAERPFVVGDVIEVGNTKGEVVSIDLMAVKLRTFDNLMVRVPNETLIKSQLTNLTRFPIRRADLVLRVAYKEDLERVVAVLMSVADAHPSCLEEPAPQCVPLAFGTSSIDLRFSFWVATGNHLGTKSEMFIAIKQAFDEHDIEIPLPHMSLYAGQATAPIPVQMVTGELTPREATHETPSREDPELFE
ncbi:MAG: mechanosensitive ion channel family protein [Bradymonadia bacterium]